MITGPHPSTVEAIERYRSGMSLTAASHGLCHPETLRKAMKRSTVETRTRTAYGPWTDPVKVETLTRLWEAGVPVIQIARAIGVGKGAVIGKAHRLGLTKRDNPVVKKCGGKPFKPPKKRVWKLKIVRNTEDNRTFPPLDRPSPFPTCQWPEGEKGDWRFCGAEPIRGRPYCHEHMLRGTRP